MGLSHKKRRMAKHQWVPADNAIPWPHCSLCGFIRRSDGKSDNKECRGPAPITLRRATTDFSLAVETRDRVVRSLDSMRFGNTVSEDPTDILLDLIQTLRLETIWMRERCRTAALEQRCERGTPWDHACTTIAKAIETLPENTGEEITDAQARPQVREGSGCDQ